MLSKLTKGSLRYRFTASASKFKFYHTSKFFKTQESTLFSETFLSGTNSVYIEQLYDNWAKDKASVPASWNAYFTNLTKGITGEKAFQLPPNLQNGASELNQAGSSTSINPSLKQALTDSFRIYFMLISYMRRGHENAAYDPLKLNKQEEQSGVKQVKKHEELNYKTYGFTEADLDRDFYVDATGILGVFGQAKVWKLREFLEIFNAIYSNKTGFEYMHIDDRSERSWLRERIEKMFSEPLPKAHKIKTWERLCKTECFNNFLKTKFNTSKRFGIEGCDSLISGLKHLVYHCGQHKIEKIVLGMPHRGRLNTLANVLDKPYEQIFAEFQDLTINSGPDSWGNSGDVKYHLGSTHDKVFPNGHRLRLNLLANPSHLEAVNPVVAGKARASQDFINTEGKRSKVLPVVMHGDAAFAGQGIVYETLQMQDLVDYTVGGTIHIVVNNQIGFTTTPREARTGLYPTDVAKTVGAPIVHVNADEPEIVDAVFQLAVDYRMQFGKDFVIDLIGYRRYGHNELDQPAFTQPLMYKIIDSMPNIYTKYTKQLLDEGVITQEQIKQKVRVYNDVMEQAYTKSRSNKFDPTKWRSEPWEDIMKPKISEMKYTGVDVDELTRLGKKLNTLHDITPHPQIKKIYEARLQSIETGKGLDWATAETLSWAALINEGYGIRLSGQDVERGTFSHRHAVVNDQQRDKKYTPLLAITPPERRHLISICNSHLSEFGVLGFEYGYSLTNPNILVMWEAQFGDFANGAQIMVDNFIVSGESKWGIQTGVTMLLPHGFDGQGPEHSSGRLERFLQLADDDYTNPPPNLFYQTDYERQFKEANVQIAIPTTASNYFHILRRQMIRDYRKPLIIMSPKKLLKYRGACSNIEDFGTHKKFKRVLDEPNEHDIVEPKKVRKVIFCTGQVYYDLYERRKERRIKDIAIVRIEQLCPFPYDRMRNITEKYSNATYIWCQEEHKNHGAWTYCESRINTILEEKGIPLISYCGRRFSASTATGSHKIHARELEQFLACAFDEKYVDVNGNGHHHHHHNTHHQHHQHDNHHHNHHHHDSHHGGHHH